MIDINLNELVYFELTEYGKKIYAEYVERNSSPYVKEFTYPNELLLWEFMNIFGKALYLGNPKVPTVDNKILIRNEDA